MTTRQANPWAVFGGVGEDPTDAVGGAFRLADDRLRTSIQNGRFALSQFGLSSESPSQTINDKLDELLWRHYIVFVTARLASAADLGPSTSTRNFVEVGVCDGLTVQFALSGAGVEAGAKAPRTRFYLLDSWGPMRPEDFAPDDKLKVGAYSYLQRERTEQNLLPWSHLTTFVQGYVPETLYDPVLPDQISWLHIDLNSSITTAATLDVLAPRIADGGVCLFDDYGWKSYRATKKVVDAFFRKRMDGTLIALPTGQALWIRHRGHPQSH